jgi:hypothetical protein
MNGTPLMANWRDPAGASPSLAVAPTSCVVT